MGTVSEIVSVTITANTRTISRKGFAQPLIFGFHTAWADAYKIYREAADMLADGFDEADRVYKMAVAFFSQADRNDTLVVGRASTAFTWGGELTITDATEGNKVSFLVMLEDGSVASVDYTILAAATTTTVATAVELLIEALTGLNSSSSGAVITITAANPGWIPYFYPQDGQKKILGAVYADTSADANYSTQLAALSLLTEGTDAEWYAVANDLISSANVQDVATYIETTKKIHAALTSDSIEASAGVLGPTLKASSLKRTFLTYHRRPHTAPHAAWLGARLALDPGSATWKFTELANVPVDILDTTERAHLDTNKVNYYDSIGGGGTTREGVMAGGEFIDITQSIDWLTARIAERVYTLLRNAKKIPFTNKGRDLIRTEILAQLREGEDRGVLEEGSSTVRVVSVSEMNPADRAARHMRTFEFGARLAGAVHKVSVRGTLSI